MRARSARATWAGYGRSRCSRSCSRRAAIASDRPPRRARLGRERPQDAAGSLQTFVSMLRRQLASDRDRARELVVTEPEAYRFATELVVFDLDRFDELLERSARQPTRARPRSLEEALDLVRGEVLEDEPYATWAIDLRGSYQGRVLGARLDAADAALAELDYARRSRTPRRRARSTASASARSASRCSRSTRSGARTRRSAATAHFRAWLDEELGLEPTAETRALESAIIRQEDVRPLLPRPIRRAHARRRRLDPSACSAGRPSSTRSSHAVRRALDGGLELIQIEGEAGLGKTRLLDELATRARGRPRRPSQLLRARAAPPLRPARDGAPRGARPARARRGSACRRSARSCPSSCSPRRSGSSPRSRCSRRSSRWSASTRRSSCCSTTSSGPTRRHSPRSATCDAAARASAVAS